MKFFFALLFFILLVVGKNNNVQFCLDTQEMVDYQKLETTDYANTQKKLFINEKLYDPKTDDWTSQCQPKPREYKVVYDAPIQSTEGPSSESPDVNKYAKGTILEISEIIKVDHRVRGKIRRTSDEWVTIRNTEEGYNLMEPLVDSAEKNTNLPGPYEVVFDINEPIQGTKDLSIESKTTNKYAKGSILNISEIKESDNRKRGKIESTSEWVTIENKDRTGDRYSLMEPFIDSVEKNTQLKPGTYMITSPETIMGASKSGEKIWDGSAMNGYGKGVILEIGEISTTEHVRGKIKGTKEWVTMKDSGYGGDRMYMEEVPEKTMFDSVFQFSAGKPEEDKHMLAFCVDTDKDEGLNAVNSSDCITVQMNTTDSSLRVMPFDENFSHNENFQSKKIDVTSFFMCDTPASLFSALSFLSLKFEYKPATKKKGIASNRKLGQTSHSNPSDLDKYLSPKTLFQKIQTTPIRVDTALATQCIRKVCGLNFYETSQDAIQSLTETNVLKLSSPIIFNYNIQN